MSKPQHLAVLKEGVDSWNQWRKLYPQLVPDLRWEDLRGYNLKGADLSGSNLRLIDLRGVNLNMADLSNADLRGADLQAANLAEAKLTGAILKEATLNSANASESNLTEANLSMADVSMTKLVKADLCRANLINTQLKKTDLTQSTIGFTIFANVDLSSALGLDTINHLGPSSIDIDTIFRSRWSIPEVFLKGLGVPEIFVDYMSSLIDRISDYYSCFISYSGEDQKLADRLFDDLQREGIRCWHAPKDAKGRERLIRQIDQVIKYHDKLLLILSQSSIDKEWAKSEIHKALKAEKEFGKRKLLVVQSDHTKLQDADEGVDQVIPKEPVAGMGRQYLYDLSMWKTDPEKYKEGLDQLISMFKASENERY